MDPQVIHADLYRIFFTSSPLPAWIYDEESTVLTAVNYAAIREFGYQEMEFLLMTRAMICRGNAAALGRLDETGVEQVSRYCRKDGSFLTAKSQEHSLLFRGRPSRLCVLEPTSRQPQVPQDLRLLASALADASVAVVVTDAGSDVTGPNIVFANAGFGQLTGYGADEVTGRPLAFFQPLHTECTSTDPGNRLSDTFDSFTYQIAALDRSGLKYSAECNVTPLRNEFGTITHYLNLQRDVTERNRLQDQLRQAERMEAVGRLAGGIAHDFNNLLTIILGYCGLLALEIKNPKTKEKSSRNLGEIQKAAEKAAVLTSQLLAFSRKQVFRPSVIGLNPIITNVEGMLRRLIGEDVDLHIDLDPNLGTVFTDSGQVEQVLMNMAVNARDAMPRGGSLVIETGNVEVTPQYAPAAGIEPGQYVLLTITDSGVGMDEETRARVFEPFFTTKEPGRGTGLGLSMTYGFVKQSGGAIKLYSEPGHGACFKIFLPRADSKLEVAGVSVSVEAPQGSGLVLVVEDDVAIRELVREMLAGGGYDVFTAANCDEAIDFVKRHPEPLDLLLTDVVLPRTSGPDLAARLRAMQSGLRVLFASGYSDHALVRQGLLEQGDAFVQKPFNASALLRIVSDMVNSKALRVRA
jgi:PAS domain S-box-containing protein